MLISFILKHWSFRDGISVDGKGNCLRWKKKINQYLKG